MQSNISFEFDSTCLGAVGITAAWRRHKVEVKNRYSPMLIIGQYESTDEIYTPASSVTINTIQGLLALRDAINEALRYDMPQSTSSD